MSQLAYTQDPAVAIPGMLVDSSLDKDIISKFLTDPTLNFGLAVTHDVGETDEEARAPAATGEVTGGAFLGVAIADTTLEQAATAVGYSSGDTMRLLRAGRLWVLTEEAIATIGLPAFVRFASGGGGTILGSFRTSADTATAVALPGATFRTTTAGAGLVVVELAPTA